MNNLRELLKASVERYSDKPALGFVNESFLTYNELWKGVQSISSFLDLKGIKKGDKVALLSANQPNWGVVYLGIVSKGAIVIPILPDFHDDEIENIIVHSEAKALFVSNGLYRKIKPELFDSLQFVLTVDAFAEVKQGLLNRELLSSTGTINSVSNFDYSEEVLPDDIATVIYTSGTTGKSKGVMLSHKNLISNAIGCNNIHHTTSNDCFLSLLPLSHTYENTVAFLLPIMRGASVTYLKKSPTPSVLISAMEVVKPTLILSVPLIIEKIYKGKVLSEINSKAVTRMLYKFPLTRKLLNRIAGKKLKETFGGELKFFGIGGAKLDPTVERFLIESKFPYAIGYGLTETAPLLAGFDSYQGKYQSTGPVVKGVTLKINEPDPITGEGEIWAKGDNVMKGYYKEPELTAEVLTPDGWFRTGDLGTFDKDGYLSIKGRLKNMIVGASGENIYPEEIEAIINRFKHVLESVVVQKKGKLVAMVHFNMEELDGKFKQFKESANSRLDSYLQELSGELQLFVNSKVNKFSRVQLVVVHNTPFEKTPTKKIKRFLYY